MGEGAMEGAPSPFLSIYLFLFLLFEKKLEFLGSFN